MQIQNTVIFFCPELFPQIFFSPRVKSIYAVASMEQACTKSDASESYKALLDTYRNALKKVREGQ